jgi:phosphate-selective porin
MAELAHSLGKIKLGGYGEIHGTFTEASESDKIDFHRMVLYLGYDFADWIKLHTETELEHAFVNDGDGEISLEQVYVDFLFSDSFNIRAGRLLTPVGIINQRHEPTLFNGVERPNFAKYMIPTTWSSDGVGFFGSLGPSLNYEAYVVAGLDGDSFSSSGIRNGRIKSRQSLNEVAFTGRLDYRPFPVSDHDLRLGLSGYFGGLDNTDGGGGSGKDGEIALVSADFEYSISRFDFRGVIANTNIDGARNFGDGVAEEMFGWYLEGAYHFWPDEWKTGRLERSDATVFVRYEEYDTQYKMPSGIAKDGSKNIDEITFGVNFYLTPDFVIKADYQIRDDASGSDKNDLFNVGLGWTF